MREDRGGPGRCPARRAGGLLPSRPRSGRQRTLQGGRSPARNDHAGWVAAATSTLDRVGSGEAAEGTARPPDIVPRRVGEERRLRQEVWVDTYSTVRRALLLNLSVGFGVRDIPGPLFIAHDGT